MNLARRALNSFRTELGDDPHGVAPGAPTMRVPVLHGEEELGVAIPDLGHGHVQTSQVALDLGEAFIRLMRMRTPRL